MIQLTVIGNLGSDAEEKQTNGDKFIIFSVASNRQYKKADGTKVQKTDWVNCLYNKTNVGPYLKKGTQVMVQGEPDLHMYANQQGQHVASCNLRVQKLELLSSNANGQEKAASRSQFAEEPPY